MKMTMTRLLLALLLCGVVTAPVLRAQDAQGASMGSTDTKSKHHWWSHSKKQKTQKTSSKRGKHEKAEPLYKSPKTVSWWHGGGPGPMGAGAK